MNLFGTSEAVLEGAKVDPNFDLWWGQGQSKIIEIAYSQYIEKGLGFIYSSNFQVARVWVCGRGARGLRIFSSGKTSGVNMCLHST